MLQNCVVGVYAKKMTSVLGTKKMERLGHSSGTTAKLAVENKRMEDRLRMLKQMMTAEKSRREAEGGLHWQSGAQHHHSEKKPVNRTAAVKSNKKPLRVKLLTHNDVCSSRLPQCGQCEKTSASLCCIECSEKYCQLCFAKFHQRGALTQHHVKPLLYKKTAPRQDMKPKQHGVEMSSSVTVSCVSGNQQTTTSAVDDGESLLEGTYNEEESAASFQQALAEWRTGGSNTTTANVVSASNMSTATQAGTGMMTREREKLRSEDIGVQFSNKNGVSYFEKLVMKRHRYDPLYLTKSHVSSDNATNQITDEELLTVNDGGSSETTPSNYNIFYCSDEDELTSLHNDLMVDDYHSQSSVEITEETYQSQLVVQARPEAVRIQLGDIPGPVKEGCVETSECKGQRSKQPGVRKKSASRNTSARRGRGQSSKMKTPLQLSDDMKMRSGGNGCQDVSVESAVKKAWHESSKQTQLTQFFLQGVQPSLPSLETSNLTEHKNNDCHEETRRELQLAASVWLPANSTVHPASELEPTRQHSSKAEITDSSDCEDQTLVMCEEKDSWVEEDDVDTLESLAWELASTVECEGRLTRCESELDDSIECSMGTPLFISDTNDMEEAITAVDMDQVMSDFELYQKQVMEQDSN